MRITEIRTRVVQWEGKTVPLPPHFCTNPMDLVSYRQASMENFSFHGWLLVEVLTDSGLVGLGNAALWHSTAGAVSSSSDPTRAESIQPCLPAVSGHSRPSRNS
jgi:L-alanine-DL-glutamate epimerase-like enolase superfamily enzyme